MKDTLEQLTKDTISYLLAKIQDADTAPTEKMQLAQSILNLTQAHTTFNNVGLGHQETIYGFLTEGSKKLKEDEKAIREQQLLDYAQQRVYDGPKDSYKDHLIADSLSGRGAYASLGKYKSD